MTNHHDGPLAVSIARLDGDAIGNDSTNLWRCRLCDGMFIAPDEDSFMHFMVGLINLNVDLEKPSERDLWEAAVYLAGRNPCRCGYHASWWQAVRFAPTATRWLPQQEERQ